MRLIENSSKTEEASIIKPSNTFKSRNNS
jgi:hypothetical protein